MGRELCTKPSSECFICQISRVCCRSSEFWDSVDSVAKQIKINFQLEWFWTTLGPLGANSLSTVTYKWFEVVYSFSCTLSSVLKTQPHPIPTKRIKVLINLISIYSCGSTDLPHDSFWFSLSSALGSVQKFNFGSHLARSWLEIIYYRYI